MTASKRLCYRFALALALQIGTAAADEFDEAQKATARELMAEGRARRAKRDLPAALESFRKADALMRAPTTALEVARTQVELGRLLEARRTLLELLARPGTSDDPTPFLRARAEALTLDRELAQRTPRLRFEVKGLHPSADARLVLDGKVVPREQWPGGLAVNPGSHGIVLFVDGQRRQRHIELQQGTALTVSFELFSRGAAVPEPTAAAAGPSSEGLSAGVYALGGVALAGVGAGATFGLIGKSEKAELEAQCAPACSAARVEHVKKMYTLANVSFAVSAVAAGAAIVLYTVQPESEKLPSTVSVRLAADPRAPALAIDGSF